MESTNYEYIQSAHHSLLLNSLVFFRTSLLTTFSKILPVSYNTGVILISNICQIIVSLAKIRFSYA